MTATSKERASPAELLEDVLDGRPSYTSSEASPENSSRTHVYLGMSYNVAGGSVSETFPSTPREKDKFLPNRQEAGQI
jgi:hypothetical protein